jgi:inhibitor of KinA
LVSFDPLKTDHAAIETVLRQLIALPPLPEAAKTPREVLVCYDADLAPDLPEVAARTGLSPEALIAAHLAGDYAVYLYGFAPGYAYLGGVPQALQLPRKDAAVRGVSAGTVIIAGPQCIVTTLTMPTGWWRIGQSPTRILRDDPARPFLFDVGDPVKFRRISRAAFEAAQ